MKSLLRSTFAAKHEDDKELLLRNHQALKDSGLGFEVMEDTVIWQYVQDFVTAHQHIPDFTTVRGHFDYIKEDEIVDRLETLSRLPAKTRGDFLRSLEGHVEERKTRQVVEILKEASRIVQTGIVIEDGKESKSLRGPHHAIQYIMDKGHDIVAPVTGVRLYGDATADGDKVMTEYDRVEADPLAGIGQFTGIAQIDSTIRGAKRGELWTHAAFTGGLKSTFLLNWTYNQAVYYRHSNVVFSLEMPYHQCRRILYAIHSAHEKFEGIRKELGIDTCLEYSKIRDGNLDAFSDDELKAMEDEARAKLLLGRLHPGRPEYRFFKEFVVPDFNDPKNEYGSIHIEVTDPDKSDFTVPDLRARAELLYAKDPDIAMVGIDHAGLMAPRKWSSSTTERLNEVLRDLKRMSMNFNRGMGMAMVDLFQISREGFKAAEKSDGRYNLTHLSYANEAERCLNLASRVVTPLGTQAVGDIRPGDQVWSSTGWRKVLNRYDNGVRRLWSVTTDRGSVLEATAPHRVRVVEDGHMGWKAVQDLTTDDYVTGTFGGVRWPEQWPSLPSLEFRWYEHKTDRAGNDVTAPDKLTLDLAYLFGAWDGDGAYHPDGIGFTGNRLEIDIRDGLRDRLSSCFSATNNLSESPSRPGSFDIRKYGRPVKRWFEALADPRGLEVPQVILRAPKAGVLAYLRGLFDTDGWINSAGIVGINLKGASEDFLRDVQMLLTGLGIDSYLFTSDPLSNQTGKRYSKVTLRIRSRLGRETFSDLIGFTDPERIGRLLEFIQAGEQTSRRGDVQMYPIPETFLRVYRLVHPPGTHQTRFKKAFHNLPPKVRKTGLMPVGALLTLLQAAQEEGIHNEDVAFLSKLSQLQVMRVVSVKDTGRDEPVVDLEVEGDHEYQTGPMLSHNSSDIVTTTYVNDDLRGRSLARWQCLKTRDDAPFKDFYSSVIWPCRLMRTCHDVTIEEAKAAGEKLDTKDLLADID